MNRVFGLILVCCLHACSSYPPLPYDAPLVPAAAETAAMTGTGDRADDPAIWVHPVSAELSLILGTNKAEGLYVYTLDGAEIQRIPVGPVNNVDIRGTLAVASNDGINALSWFRIEHSAETAVVKHLGETSIERIEPYGICLGRPGGRTVAAVTYKDGAVELWEVTERATGLPDARLDRTVLLDSQLEGCVFDDAAQRLFVGEEGFGVWALDLDRPDARPIEVDSITSGNGLAADVEGLSLYLRPDGTGYLLASAQVADRFVLYERTPPFRVIGAFKIGGSGEVDAVTHTDGLDITSRPLPGYPRGLLVVQDDGNPGPGVDQNFKLVDWRDVERAIAQLESMKPAAP